MPEGTVADKRGSPESGHDFLSRPSTELGRWSVRLMAAFVVLFIINFAVFMPSDVEVP